MWEKKGLQADQIVVFQLEFQVSTPFAAGTSTSGEYIIDMSIGVITL